MNFDFSAEELTVGALVSPWNSPNNRFRVTSSNACCGSKSFSSQGTGFWGSGTSRIYELRTPLFTSSVSNMNLITVGFSYRVYMPIFPGSTNTPPAAPPTWSYEVILRQFDTATPTPNITDTNISNGTVTNSGNTKDADNPSVDGCAKFFEDVNIALTNGYSYQIIIRFWTNNSETSTQNYVTVDCIKTQSNVLSDDVNETLDGLTEPTYAKTTGSATVNNSGHLLADISLAKSAQSAVSCGTDSTQSSNPPHCSLAGVQAIYYVEKYNKSTGDFVSISDIDTFSIAYGSGASTAFSKSAVLFEDATYTYKHIVGYEVWSTDNDYGLKMVHEVFDAPAKPARTLTISYFAGFFKASLNGPITDNITVSNLEVKGYANSSCTTHLETHNLSGSIAILAGDLMEESDAGTPLTCEYSIRRKIYNGATINGTGLSSGGTITINGHVITLSIVSSCVPYAC